MRIGARMRESLARAGSVNWGMNPMQAPSRSSCDARPAITPIPFGAQASASMASRRNLHFCCSISSRASGSSRSLDPRVLPLSPSLLSPVTPQISTGSNQFRRVAAYISCTWACTWTMDGLASVPISGPACCMLQLIHWPAAWSIAAAASHIPVGSRETYRSM